MKGIISLLALWILFPVKGAPARIKDCDFVMITVRSEYFTATEVPGLICKQKIFYDLPFLLNELKIKAEKKGSTISGTLGSNSIPYSIDLDKKIAWVDNVKVNLDDGIIFSDDSIFLKTVYFQQIFGIGLLYNPSEISCKLSSRYELPIIRLSKFDKNRKRITGFSDESDTIDIRQFRERNLLGIGEITWDIFHSQSHTGSNSTRLSVGTGGNFMGGEFLMGLNHNLNSSFSWRNQFYRWRWVQNDARHVNQIILGKIPHTFTSDIFSPIHGIMINNQKTAREKIFSQYTIHENGEPGWTVEVYVNSVLIDYLKVPDNGQISFKVPIFYGNNTIELKYYSPWGNVKSEIREMYIPTFLVEKGKIKYSASAALIANGEGGKVGNFSAAYGLSHNISVSAGAEYLSRRPTERNLVPFFGTSLSLPHNIIISHRQLFNLGQETNLLFNKELLQVDLNYSSYRANHSFLKQRYNERISAQISYPWRFNDFRGSSFFSLSRNRLNHLKFTQINWQLNMDIKKFPLSIDSQALIYPNSSSVFFTRFQTFLSFTENLSWRPEVTLNMYPVSLRRIRNEINFSPFKNSVLTIAYDNYLINDYSNLNIGFRWNLNFANTGLNIISTRKKFISNQYASGSILVDKKFKNLHVKNFRSIGFNSAKFIAFFDKNNDGQLNKNEEVLPYVDIHMLSSGVKNKLKDATLFTTIKPFKVHRFKVSSASIPRMDWKVKKPEISLWFNSNEYKIKYVPVVAVAEITGMVKMKSNMKGIENLHLQIINMDSKEVFPVETYTNGQFNFLGLEKGKYRIRLAEEKDFELVNEYEFEIQNKEGGEILNDITILINKKL